MAFEKSELIDRVLKMEGWLVFQFTIILLREKAFCLPSLEVWIKIKSVDMHNMYEWLSCVYTIFLLYYKRGSCAHYELLFPLICLYRHGCRLLSYGGAVVFNLYIPITKPAKVSSMLTYVFVDDELKEEILDLIDYGVMCLKPQFIGDFLIQVCNFCVINLF